MICLRAAQTTVGDLSHTARSVGLILGPGLVAAGGDGPSLNAYPPDLAA
ncbi:MAG: hypothetical protein IKJ45_12575 [Kiritimatiellae bacterium]|nr:hypothetical protein [Kiritimatiellia bacterium]